MIAAIRYAPYIVGALLLIGLLYFRGEAIKAEAERDLLQDKLTIALAQNREKDKTIDLLQAWKDRSDGILTDLTAKIEKLSSDSQAIQDEITNLGKTDADAKTWLDTPVPDSVRRVLNRKARNGQQYRFPLSARATSCGSQRARPPDKRAVGE